MNMGRFDEAVDHIEQDRQSLDLVYHNGVQSAWQGKDSGLKGIGIARQRAFCSNVQQIYIGRRGNTENFSQERAFSGAPSAKQEKTLRIWQDTLSLEHTPKSPRKIGVYSNIQSSQRDWAQGGPNSSPDGSELC
jgi:hypothetical protein